jgi:hypothetical protein
MPENEPPIQLDIPGPLDHTVWGETGVVPESRQARMIRLAHELLSLGVSGNQVPKLLMQDLDLVEKQLLWLPYRSARKKASLIVSAIENDYEAPANLDAHEE